MLLSNPTLTRAEFFDLLAGRLRTQRGGRALEDRASSASSRQALGRHVDRRSGARLVVDEAQSLPYELLEEMRLLDERQGETTAALAVALVGQPELAAR